MNGQGIIAINAERERAIIRIRGELVKYDTEPLEDLAGQIESYVLRNEAVFRKADLWEKVIWAKRMQNQK
jgi:hypothetical protein